jgi:predicted N-formylglutamate amidohydrolase
MGRASGNPFLVTCEHASNRLPARYGALGLEPARLSEHIAWDPGSLEIARALARRLGCPLHEGRYSRLLIDLNRNLRHPKLIAQRSFGVEIPGNQNLDAAERERRIREYWTPYRDRVLSDIRSIVERAGRCIHFGVHSFTPVVDGVERDVCVALLYDPSRGTEVEVAGKIGAPLKAGGVRVRRNYPYRGVSDGLVTACRKLFGESEYAGIEIEVSQKLLGSDQGVRRIAEALIGSVAAL